MINDEKRELRKNVRGFLKTLPAADIASRSIGICRGIMSLDEFTKARVAMLYMPVAGEVDIMPIIMSALDRGTKICFPVITGAGSMEAVGCDSIEGMVKGEYGIPRPASGAVYPPDGIDVIIVPGLAFDEGGGRLGKGAGFYDRFMKDSKAVRIAPAFDGQVVQRVPVDEYDQRIDILVTEDRVIYCQRKV